MFDSFVRAVSGIELIVKEGLIVVTPSERIGAVFDLVRRQMSRLERFDLERVRLTAVRVCRVGEKFMISAHA